MPEKVIPLLLILVLCLNCASAERETYSLDSGIHCYKCPVGTKVQTDCTEDFTEPICVPCGDHEYNDKENGNKHCSACKPGCPKNGVEVTGCTPKTNRVCICEPGFHRFPLDPIDPHFECRPHSKCEEREGVIYKGNFTHDTQCEKCQAGREYLDQSDTETPVCRDCLNCPPGSQQISVCSLFNNTQCSDGNYTFYGNVTTPAPEKGQQSRSLSGAAIFGIVYSIFVVVGAIAAVALYCYMDRGGFSLYDKQKFLMVLMVVLGLGLFFAVIFFCIACCGESRSEGSVGYTPAPPEDPQQNGRTPAEGWSRGFITGRGFNYLSNNLGEEWQRFINELPGWTTRSATVIAHKKMENPHSVPNQIHGCLDDWACQAPDRVTKTEIMRALREVEQQEVAEGLEEKYAEWLAGDGRVQVN